VEKIPLHGGSIILHMRRKELATKPSERLVTMLRQERAEQLTDPARLATFASDVTDWKLKFEALIDRLQSEGATLIGYGAAAKANTLMCYCPSAAKALGRILDRSVLKQGLYTPGTHIKVEPIEHWRNGSSARGREATHMVLLAWNFKDEIMAQMKPFSDAGGRFVVPIPEPEVL
jgi:hypothetical protein